MATIKEQGEQAIARLKERGISQEEAGGALGSATAEEISQLAELPPVSPIGGTTPDLSTTEGLLAATEGLRPKDMAFSFDPMADIREEMKPEAEQIEAAGLREEEAIKAGVASQVALTTREFNRQISAVREQMTRELSGVEAISGRRAGLGASTTLQANLQMTQQAYERKISNIQSQIEDAKMRGQITESAALAAAAKSTKEEINKLYKDVWDMNMDMWGIQDKMADNARAQTQVDWDIMSKLSKDETWTSPTTGVTYTGVSEPDPFFTSSNIVSLMKAIPIGTTQQIEDPNTGELWSVSGLGKPDINQKVMSWVDPNNNQIITIFDEVKGEIIKQVNGGKVRPPTSLVTFGLREALEEEKATNLAIEESDIATRMIENVGEGDGYTDPNIYMEERGNYSGSSDDFDEKFAPYLSPQERARLGVGKAVGVKAIPEDEESIEDLLFGE